LYYDEISNGKFPEIRFNFNALPFAEIFELVDNLKGRGHCEDLDVDGRIILRPILEKDGVSLRV
jgi:hypothetical protein